MPLLLSLLTCFEPLRSWNMTPKRKGENGVRAPFLGHCLLALSVCLFILCQNPG